MAVRLSKVAREFNVGLSTIVDYLQEKGIKISSDPNAKLTDDQYSLVAKEFSTDSEAKKESNRVDLKNTRLKSTKVFTSKLIAHTIFPTTPNQTQKLSGFQHHPHSDIRRE